MTLSITQMREKSIAQLKEELLVQRRAQMNLRFQAAGMQLSKT